MKYIIRLIKYAKPYWIYLIIAGLSTLAVTGLNLLGPWLITLLINIVTNITKYPNAPKEILNISIFLTLSYILRLIFQFLNNYLSHYGAWNLVAYMRSLVYEKLQQLSLRYYHDKQTGQLMSRVINDTATFETLIAHAIPDLMTNALILIGVTIILFILNPTLAFLSLVPIPPLIYIGILFTKKILPNFRAAQRVLADLNADVQDNLSGIREIQAFNQQDKEKAKIKKQAYNHANALIGALKQSAIFHPSVAFFSSLGTVIVVSLGGMMALKGKLQVSDIVGFILYLNMFYQPIAALGQVLENLQQALAGAERAFEVLDTEPDVKEVPNPTVLKNIHGKITFENVNFAYNPNKPILKNVSFEIKPGQMVAFVGPTGVGKTTIMSLINRFYDVDSGTIKIDDTDIKSATLRSLRDNISMVLQDVFLFNGTIAQNIAYGCENASMEDIMKAAKIACADNFISQMPDGYNTYVGERGMRLSGGQKQRLSIARAVLKDSPILILDEATSSVDAETEREIQNAINNIAGTRTILIIAHRLSTVKKADNIIVLNEGRIIEQGTHNELISKNGLYHYLCSMQFMQNEDENDMLKSTGNEELA